MKPTSKKKIKPAKLSLAAQKRQELLADKPSRGDETRKEILEAAVTLFSKHGFDQVSLKMIGDVVGISQAAVAQHYGNRRNIILKVRELVTRHNRNYVDTHISPEESSQNQLVQYVYNNYQWACENPAYWQIILLTYYFSLSDEDFSHIHTEGVRLGAERIEWYLILIQRTERLNIDSKLRFQIAEDVHRYAIGLLAREIAKPIKDRMKNKELLERIQNAVKLLIFPMK